MVACKYNVACGSVGGLSKVWPYYHIRTKIESDYGHYNLYHWLIASTDTVTYDSVTLTLSQCVSVSDTVSVTDRVGVSVTPAWRYHYQYEYLKVAECDVATGPWLQQRLDYTEQRSQLHMINLTAVFCWIHTNPLCFLEEFHNQTKLPEIVSHR